MKKNMTKPEDLLKESAFCKKNISRELGLNIHSLSLIHISEPTRPERIGVGGLGL